jgi:hypothetical protein
MHIRRELPRDPGVDIRPFTSFWGAGLAIEPGPIAVTASRC